MASKTENTFGRGHNEYFSKLNSLLKESGPGHPVIVLDLDILDHNIAVLNRKIAPPKSLRVVVKSLPSIELIRQCITRILESSTGTTRIV